MQYIYRLSLELKHAQLFTRRWHFKLSSFKFTHWLVYKMEIPKSVPDHLHCNFQTINLYMKTKLCNINHKFSRESNTTTLPPLVDYKIQLRFFSRAWSRMSSKQSCWHILIAFLFHWNRFTLSHEIFIWNNKFFFLSFEILGFSSVRTHAITKSSQHIFYVPKLRDTFI